MLHPCNDTQKNGLLLNPVKDILNSTVFADFSADQKKTAMQKIILLFSFCLCGITGASAQQDTLRNMYGQIAAVSADSSEISFKMLAGDIPRKKQLVSLNGVMISCGIGTFPLADAEVTKIKDSTIYLKVIKKTAGEGSRNEFRAGNPSSLEWSGKRTGELKSEKSVWELLWNR